MNVTERLKVRIVLELIPFAKIVFTFFKESLQKRIALMHKLTVGSCFSGIGGLELGLEWTGGFETRWQIEIDPYASAVLKKHWPNVKRYGDITTIGGGDLEPVDVICGGFPCQDVSFAGARKGLEGKRSTLWGEMFRLVCEVKPRWVVAENVPGLLSSDDGRFFGNILRDLASAGYDAEWGVLSAAGVGAPHLRKRVFILAYPVMHSNTRTKQREHGEEKEISGVNRKKNCPSGEFSRASEFVSWSNDSHQDDVSDTYGAGLQAERPEQPTAGFVINREQSHWSVEPNVGRVAHGISSRVDRLKCLGNAVVPQVAQKIGEMILDYERKRPRKGRKDLR